MKRMTFLRSSFLVFVTIIFSFSFLFADSIPWTEDVITDLGQPVSGVTNIWTVTTAGLDGKIYGGTSDGYLGSHMFIFDPEAQIFTDLGQPGYEVYTLTTGKDSLIYGGTYTAPDTNAHFFVYNPYKPWNPGNATYNNPRDLGVAIPGAQYPNISIIWDVTTGIDGKIYGGTGYAYYVGATDYSHLFVYDPETETITDLGVPIPNQWCIIRLTTGPDGKIYGAVRPSGHLFVYDPITGTFTDLGAPVSGDNILSLTTLDSLIYGGTHPNGHLFSYNPKINVFADLGKVSPDYNTIWTLTTGKNGRIYGGEGPHGYFFSYDPRISWNPGTTPDNNPRDYGQAVRGEARVRSLITTSDGLIYGGTAWHAHLFVFVPYPIIAIHFVDQNYDPYPFNITLASYGGWRKNYEDVYNLITETPPLVSFFPSYAFFTPVGEQYETGNFVMDFQPGDYKEFNFYAIEFDSLSSGFKPFIVSEEKDSPFPLAWEFNPGTKTLSVINATGEAHGKTVFSVSIPNGFVIDSAWFNFPRVWEWHCFEDEGYYHYYDSTWYYSNEHKWVKDMQLASPPGGTIATFTYSEIDSNLGAIRLWKLIDNGQIVFYVPREHSSLYNIESAVVSYPSFFDPEYIVSPGIYLLNLDSIPKQYVSWIKLPLKIDSGEQKSILFNSISIDSLYAFDFNIVAQDPFLYEKIIPVISHNTSEDRLNVSIEWDSPVKNKFLEWWGQFILPDTIDIYSITNHSSPESTLIFLDDYLSYNFENYRIVNFRGSYKTQEVSLKYGIHAEVDVHPKTLNIKSHGNWITTYIEFPTHYSPYNVDLTSAILEYRDTKIPNLTEQYRVEDHNNNGIPELILKFDRKSLVEILQSLKSDTEIEMKLSGEMLTGKRFAGSDRIRIIICNKDVINDIQQTHAKNFYIKVENLSNSRSINYFLPVASAVSLKIYDISGRLVKTLLNEEQDKGLHRVSWYYRDSKIPKGTYFYYFKTPLFTKVIKDVIFY